MIADDPVGGSPLATIDATNEVFKSFGTIIIDECPHVPAKTFKRAIQNFSSYHCMVTATSIRKIIMKN
jgi:superfamily II DNA or RNA helicase